MWKSPLEFPPSSTDVLTRNPRSRVAMQELRDREERLHREAAKRSKLRRMAAKGLLATQIDAASGLALGHAFKLQREQEEERQRVVRKARREAEKRRQRRRPGQAPAKKPPLAAAISSPSRATTAPEGAVRTSRRGHGRAAWDTSGKRPKTAEEARAERTTAIQNIAARNEQTKAALVQRAVASAGVSPAKRSASTAPALSYEALSATADHFPMHSNMGAAFEFSESDSDDDADDLPGLENQQLRPVTAPLQPAGHVFNHLDELAHRPLSGGLVRGRPNDSTRDTLKSVDAAYSHARWDEDSRPTTPYLEQVLANESIYRASAGSSAAQLASMSAVLGPDASAVLVLDAVLGGEDEDGGSDEEAEGESRDVFRNTSLMSVAPTPDQMFRLCSCGITTQMTAGIGAQIAQCQNPGASEPEDPFRVDLRDNGFGDLGALAVIEGVLANPRVTSLDLAQNRLGSSTGSALQTALGKSALTELDVSGNPIGNKGVGSLCAALGSSYKLEILKLEKCGFDSNGAAALTKALRDGASGLRDLSIAGNMVGTGRGGTGRLAAEDLVHELANSNLERLNLSWNSFGDVGAMAFVEAARERGVDGASLTSLDMTAANLSEQGADALCGLMSECTGLNTLLLNQNAGIGFRGALPFLKLKQAGEIDQVTFGRGASSERPDSIEPAERWRVVELRGCGCENLPLPSFEASIMSEISYVIEDGAPPPKGEAESAGDVSTQMSFAAPALASAEQKYLLACSMAGWGDEIPFRWKQELPHELVDHHFEMLYAARKATRQAKADEQAAAAAAAHRLTPEEIEQALTLKAQQEDEEAHAAAALAQRETLEAAEAELAARKEWGDVKAIEMRIRSLEAQFEELLHGDDMDALDRIQATIFQLREQLDHERWEAEEADKVAAKERAEAEQAAATAEAERLEAEAAGAAAAAKAAKPRKKKKAASGLRVQASRGHSSGAKTAPSAYGKQRLTSPTVSAVANRKTAAMARMALTPTRSPTRETRVRSKTMDVKAWQSTKSFNRAVRQQVNMQKLKQQSAATMCKSLKLPLRPSSASGPMGQGASAPLLGSFSADPLDMRLRRGASQEQRLRKQPLEHGLSFQHPQLMTEKERKRPTGIADGGQENAAWEARQAARKARAQTEKHPRAVDTVISPQRHPSLYA